MNPMLKKRLDWALDKFNDAAVGFYGMTTAEKWLAFMRGDLSIPDGARLTGATLLLLAAWSIIGLLKGLLENNNERH
ncbi:MAG: hypothetical protein AB1768_17760 [Pseudomonadota bacterium]|jgi:hypothetical protein